MPRKSAVKKNKANIIFSCNFDLFTSSIKSNMLNRHRPITKNIIYFSPSVIIFIHGASFGIVEKILVRSRDAHCASAKSTPMQCFCAGEHSSPLHFPKYVGRRGLRPLHNFALFPNRLLFYIIISFCPDRYICFILQIFEYIRPIFFDIMPLIRVFYA